MPSDSNLDKQFDSILRIYESKLERKLRANFNYLSRQMLQAWIESGEFIAQGAITANEEQLEEILQDAYEQTIIAGSRFGRRMVEDPDKKKEDDLAEEALLLLLLWTREEAARTSKELNKTTRKIFNKFLDEGIKEGLTNSPTIVDGATGATSTGKNELSDFVIKQTKKANMNRAKTKATTEAQAGLQNGIETSADVMNKQALTVLKKKWRSQQDSRVRDSHARVNSQVKEIGDYFLVGRGRGLRPLDKNLPKEEVINCRCYLILSKHNVITEV
jgi:hypothetical protein